MKKSTYCLLLFLLSGYSSFAQYVTIPDTTLRGLLYRGFHPYCFNEEHQMDTTCKQIVEFEVLSFNNKSLHNLDGIQYFDNLRALQITGNHLTSLPRLPNKLKIFECNFNPLEILPKLPDSLQLLDCKNNNLKSLPELPASLTYLDCGYNQLTQLPALPDNLKILNCYNNQLTSLPAFNDSLMALTANNNLFSQLPICPPSLKYIRCWSNLLTSLPDLPPSLIDLACSDNMLTNIPPLPNTLKYLSLNRNQLSILPSVPKGIIQLNCGENELTSLPHLPNTLTVLDAGYNWLTSFQDSMPPKLTHLILGGNCFQKMPVLPANLAQDKWNNVGPNRSDCIPTSMETDEESSFYFIYPNPAQDKLFIKSEEIVKEYEVFTSFGNKVELPSDHTNALDISPLAPSIYYIKWKTERGETIQRFVKQ